MNFYLLFLGLYSLCIFPLRIRLELQMGKRLGNRVLVRVVGVHLQEKRFRIFGTRSEADKEEEGKAAGEEQEHDLTQALWHMDRILIRCLLSPALWRKVFRSVQFHQISVRVRIAMEDAAATALCYTALTVLMDVMKRIGIGSPIMDYKADTDFSGKGSEAVIVGILSVRLGSIALVASRFVMEYQRRKGALKSDKAMKEEEYAAASHR